MYLISGSQFLDRVEILTANEVSPGPDLYFPVEDHCIVKLTDETFYLIGGYNGPYSYAFSIIFSLLSDM